VQVEVIVLNGGSSAGKSSLATCLQERLDGTWVTLGIDDLIHALSHGPADRGGGGTIDFAPDGSVSVGERFRRAEAAWYDGVAAMARSGLGVVVDDVFLDAGESQSRLRAAFEGLTVIWVGVQCRPDVAEARELEREGRIRGMARDQAERVHAGVRYDLVVDTTETSAAECATAIAALVRAAPAPAPNC
jgi:chloramphenicol 3-O phosphotransferase